MSAMGSVIMGGSPARSSSCSPAGLDQAGDVPPAGQVPQAEAAHAEAPEEGARPSAEGAPVVGAHLELRRAGRLHHERGLRHRCLVLRPQARNGMPSARRTALPSASLRALVQLTTPSPFLFSTLSRLLAGKITCSRRPRG